MRAIFVALHDDAFGEGKADRESSRRPGSASSPHRASRRSSSATGTSLARTRVPGLDCVRRDPHIAVLVRGCVFDRGRRLRRGGGLLSFRFSGLTWGEFTGSLPPRTGGLPTSSNAGSLPVQGGEARTRVGGRVGGWHSNRWGPIASIGFALFAYHPFAPCLTRRRVFRCGIDADPGPCAFSLPQRCRFPMFHRCICVRKLPADIGNGTHGGIEKPRSRFVLLIRHHARLVRQGA